MAVFKRVCTICGQPFKSTVHNTRVCGTECKQALKVKRRKEWGERNPGYDRERMRRKRLSQEMESKHE